MKRKIIIIAFCTLLFCTSIISVTGMSLIKSNIFGNVKCPITMQIKDLETDISLLNSNMISEQIAVCEDLDISFKGDPEKQVQLLQNKYEILKLQKQLDDINSELLLKDKEKQQQIDIARYNVSQYCYNIYMLEQSKISANKNLNLLDLQLDIEDKKEDLGESLYNNKALIESQIQIENLKLYEADNNIYSIKKSIECTCEDTDIIIDVADIVDDVDTSSLSSSTCDIETLKNSYFENDINYLLKQDLIINQQKYADGLSDLFGSSSEICLVQQKTTEKMQKELELYTLQCETKIEAKLNNYNSAIFTYNATQNYCDEILKTIAILKECYEKGGISKLEYLSQSNSYEGQFNNCATQKIQVLKDIDEISLVEKGVIVS